VIAGTTRRIGLAPAGERVELAIFSCGEGTPMIVTVALLRAAGLTEVQINRVTELADAEVTEKRRAQNRIAQQNHRARKHMTADGQQCHADSADRGYTSSSLLTSLPSIDRPLSVAARVSNWPRDYREQFWAAYPKKREQPYALKCLDKVRRSGEVTFAALMAGVARIDRADPKFIKNPSTWLNRGCWTDGEGATAEVDKTDYTLLEQFHAANRRRAANGETKTR
jgi:hypothetical protein